jgi:exonuclease SbcD
MTGLRVLLLADTHLGFDWTDRPRSDQVRRGPDFFANVERCLAVARAERVDLVVHGGDLLFRSRVPLHLAQAALEPLLRLADEGVPVILVPGNHERSRLPFPLLACHEHLHVLDRPRTVTVLRRGIRVALAGFPCATGGVRAGFPALVAATRGREVPADVRLLCLHQAVEGARVGPADFTFTGGEDVVRGADLPGGFAAVLAGHIHRAQTLTHDLAGHPLAAPVLYPGSIERTSRAERGEDKGFLILDLEPDPATGGRLAASRFVPLPARPLIDLVVPVTGLGRRALADRLRADLRRQPPRAVVRLLLEGVLDLDAAHALRAAALREVTPPEMIVECRLAPEPL